MNLPNGSEKIPDKINIFNINPTEKYILFTPPRTGSRRSLYISELLGFDTFMSTNGTLSFYKNGPSHNHTHNLFQGHEEFKTILTCRNPYSIMVSEFKLSLGPSTSIRKDFDIHTSFLDFIYEFYDSNASPWYSPKSFKFREDLSRRQIDYRIKIENMFESYSEIPIVKESKMYQDGTLENLVTEIIGHHSEYKNMKYLTNLPEDFKEYYTTEIAEFIKSNFHELFEFMDYNIDSWK